MTWDTIEEAKLERLLRENENRGKTPEQQIREGMTWEPIEEAKAKKTQGTRTDLNLSKKFEKSWSSDIIARRVGLGSGVSVTLSRKFALHHPVV